MNSNSRNSEQYSIESSKLKLGIEAEMDFDSDFDVSALLLNSNLNLLSDEHLLFYNSPIYEIQGDRYLSLPDRSMYFWSCEHTKAENKFDELFYIEFDKINKFTHEIRLVIHLEGFRGMPFFNNNCKFIVKVLSFFTNEKLAEFVFDSNYDKKGAIELIVIKRQKSKWFIIKSENTYQGYLGELFEKFN
jgi:stress response protein SCP2